MLPVMTTAGSLVMLYFLISSSESAMLSSFVSFTFIVFCFWMKSTAILMLKHSLQSVPSRFSTTSFVSISDAFSFVVVGAAIIKYSPTAIDITITIIRYVLKFVDSFFMVIPSNGFLYNWYLCFCPFAGIKLSQSGNEKGIG